ncbi:MAG: hypothetical protein V4659_05185 [Pseudomonadota bacterium]
MFAFMLPIALALTSAAQAPATSTAATPAWGAWVYVQGDKAVQYRVAKVGQDGDVARLKYQLRVEPGNTVACYSDRCSGYVVYLPVFDPLAVSVVATHHVFFPRGSAATWDMPETVRFPIRTSATGRRFLDERGLPMYEIFDNPGVLKVTEVLQACVDDQIDGADTRCTDYDAGQAVRVGG